MWLRRVGAGAVGGSLVCAGWLAVDDRARNAVIPGNQVSRKGIARFAVTVGNAAVTAADYKWSLYGTDKEQRPEEYKELLRQVNLRSAKRLLKVCLHHGGLYTKFGQSIANLNHALPAEFTDTLAPLQDRASFMPRDMLIDTVERELGGAPINQVFSSFEEEPVAAASLAQVHRAVLRDSGEKVAVKVQYPYLRDQTQGDLSTLRLLTDLVGYLFPDFSYSWLTPEFENNMTLELDFIQEARNGERLGKLFKSNKDVKVPAIHWRLCTPRMLVMDFIDGIKVNDVATLEKKGINPLQVAETVSAVFGDMIHVHGFVHCDPHAGNMMVVPEQPMCMVEHFWKRPFKSAAAFCYITTAAVFATATSGLLVPGSTEALIAAAGAIGTIGLAGILALFDKDKISNRPYQLVVLDHGMYRRLEPEFRTAYCSLWKALLLRDEFLGKKAAIELGMKAEEFEALSLIFAFRSPRSAQITGARMNKEERQRIREQYKDVSAGDINLFLQRLPRDLLFVMRSTNIVRAINLSLGGTTRLRFKIMGESAVRGMLVANPDEAAFLKGIPADLPTSGAYRLNLPVASEVVKNVDTISYRQAFEIWRLRTFLSLVDNSWGFLAWFVKIL